MSESQTDFDSLLATLPARFLLLTEAAELTPDLRRAVGSPEADVWVRLPAGSASTATDRIAVTAPDDSTTVLALVATPDPDADAPDADWMSLGSFEVDGTDTLTEAADYRRIDAVEVDNAEGD